MYRKRILFWACLVVLLTQHVSAASFFQIGHSRIGLTDPSRENRVITAELYYPAVLAGEDVTAAAGTFPLIIFAHGYQQTYDNYHALQEELVPRGYILLFPTTEGGLTIDINNYAADLTFLGQAFLQETPPAETSIVAGHLSARLAYMGHSTGGGASYLAQSSKPLAATVVTLAALANLHGPISGNTDPIDGAATVTVPSLLLAGEEDCICPVDMHQQPLYDKLAAPAKVLVRIIHGDHCGFSDSPICSLAEFTRCGLPLQGETMPEDEQMQLSLDFLIPWLDYFLKNDQAAWSLFQASLAATKHETRISFSPGVME